MQRLIVQWLEIIAVIGFVLLVLGSGILGAQMNGGVGFLVGAVAGFFAGVVFFGALFLLIEMNKNMRAIRSSLAHGAGTPAE
jgi:hypothetical protein